jgi:hypothetical protein
MASTEHTYSVTASAAYTPTMRKKAFDCLYSALAFSTKDVGDRCKHLVQHFTRPHYRLDKEGIANAQLGLYLARNHYVKARLESCEMCRQGLLLII